MSKQLVIIGASGHGKVIADIAEKNGYEKILFFDDNPAATECCGYPVIGLIQDVKRFPGSDFIVAIGNAGIREKMQMALIDAGLRPVSLVHPKAVIGKQVTLGEGSVVMAGAVVNPCCRIGKGCIINTCASVDHDCTIGDYTHISVGAHVAGTVTIGNRTWIGAGATVSNNVRGS